jgi:hypothetical protein
MTVTTVMGLTLDPIELDHQLPVIHPLFFRRLCLLVDRNLGHSPLTLSCSGQALSLLIIDLLKDGLRFRDVVHRGLPPGIERASLRAHGPSLEVRKLSVMPHLLCKQLTLVLLILSFIVLGRCLPDSFLLHLGLHFLFLYRDEGVETEGLYVLFVVSLELLDEWVLLQTLKFGTVRIVEVSMVVFFDLKFLELSFNLRQIHSFLNY